MVYQIFLPMGLRCARASRARELRYYRHSLFCVIVIVKLLSWAVLPFLHSRWVPSKNGPVFSFQRPSKLHWLHHVFLLFANLGPIQLSPWIFLLLMPRLLLSRWSIPGFFVHMNVIVCYSTINIFSTQGAVYLHEWQDHTTRILLLQEFV